MSIKYTTSFCHGDFEGAEHDVRLELEDNTVQINAGCYEQNHATLTLEQFDKIAEEVARYREMQAIKVGQVPNSGEIQHISGAKQIYMPVADDE